MLGGSTGLLFSVESCIPVLVKVRGTAMVIMFPRCVDSPDAEGWRACRCGMGVTRISVKRFRGRRDGSQWMRCLILSGYRYAGSGVHFIAVLGEDEVSCITT